MDVPEGSPGMLPGKLHKVGPKLGIEPMDLLAMINGRVAPTQAVIAGLARELDSNVTYLTKLAGEISL